MALKYIKFLSLDIQVCRVRGKGLEVAPVGNRFFEKGVDQVLVKNISGPQRRGKFVLARGRRSIIINPGSSMTIHLIIKGKVQGVYFRATAKQMADGLGVKGWVKNTKDGNVELMASGKEASVQRFVSWCGQGPTGALVTDVELVEKQEQDFEYFLILK
jgi:acylphosphatase